MGYRYILLLAHRAPLDRSTPLLAHSERTLRSMGLERRWESSHAQLFASNRTPTLISPEGNIVIGHLFDDNFKRVTSDSSSSVGDGAITKNALRSCWGEYLFLQQDADRPVRIRIDRDPSGGVPCVYSTREPVSFVTSDISLAIALGIAEKHIDWTHIASSLVYPRLRCGRTGLSDIRELLPGCSLTVEDSAARTGCEWSPWHHVGDRRFDDPIEASDTLRNVVVEVVKTWARTDGSALLELSGGLDSSIVGACLRDTGTRIACSTLFAAVPGTDERPYAGLIADLLGVELRSDEIPLNEAQFDFEIPADSVAPAIGMLQYASNGIKEAVASELSIDAYYSGGGGDSVFCYLRTAAPAADAFLERGVFGGLAAIRNLSHLHQCTVWKAARLTGRKLFHAGASQSGRDTSFLSPMLEAAEPKHPWFPAPAGTLPGDRERVFDLAGTQMFRESVPRGRTRWFRMPLLSQPIVETCLGIPSWMWIANGHDRSVARSAFSDVIPGAILNRRSKGTFMNYWGAAYHRNRKQMREFLLTGLLQSRGILDSKAIREAFDSNVTPRDQSLMRLFNLCMVENWARQQRQ